MKIRVEWQKESNRNPGTFYWHFEPWWNEFCGDMMMLDEINAALAPWGARYEEDYEASEGWIISTDERLFSLFLLRWS